jgi:superfamily II DNA helicase RecQ
MLLSATADETLMRYVSNFMSLGDYHVIGSNENYSIPNVKIIVITHDRFKEREFLLNMIVRHCNNLLEKKSERQFKIHAITMSRHDAHDLCERLNTAGVPSMWLTSSLPPAQKSYQLQMWEEGNEKVLVSTFTDGIDNSATEDVIIIGGTYSIYNLVQAIGRIRPKRQSLVNSSVYIFHSSRYLEFDDQSIEDNVSIATGANIFPYQDSSAATVYYKKMFHIHGYQKWLDQAQCYRKTLYEHFSIMSRPCNHCSNCMKKSNINQSAVRASTLITKEEKQIKIVLGALEIMQAKCLVCMHTECNGIQCFPSKPSRCFCCHVGIVRSTFHKSSQCPADTSGKKIDTKGQACPSCFMSFSKSIPERGSLEDHRNNVCRFQKRIKRVFAVWCGECH